MIRFVLGILAGAGLTLMYGASKAQERKEAEAKTTPPETGEQAEKKEDKVVAGEEPTNPTT